ncbi:MAG: hypothetical protein ABI895_35515 [Deltaproteobacteria bacterium]
MNATISASNTRTARRLRRALAALGVLALMTLSGTVLADPPVSAKANRHFEEGVRYLTTHDADRFEKAYAQFRSAYADSPTWKILNNLGIVAEALERDGEAIDWYRAYIADGAKNISAAEREQYTSDLSRLELGSASVSIRVEPDGAWIIDERSPEEGKPILNRYGPSSGTVTLRLRAGRHRLHVELGGRSTETWELEALPGGSGSHAFDVQPRTARPPAAHPEPREDRGNDTNDSDPMGGSSAGKIAGYASLGLGAVGAGLGSYFFVRSLDRRHEGERAHERCRAVMSASCQLSDEKTDAETRERVRSGVSFGVAGALVATGVLLLLFSGDSGAPASDEAALTPWVGPRQLGISGRF